MLSKEHTKKINYLYDNMAIVVDAAAIEVGKQHLEQELEIITKQVEIINCNNTSLEAKNQAYQQQSNISGQSIKDYYYIVKGYYVARMYSKLEKAI